MKTIIAVLTLTLLLLSARSEEVFLENTRVSIPYSELKTLLDAARKSETEKPKPDPPLDAVLTSARYHLDFSTENPKLTADFDARGITDAWHSLPLFGGETKVESAEALAAPVSIVRKEDFFTMLAEGAQTFTARLTLAVPSASEWSEGEGLSFCPASATLNELRVSGLPEGRRLHIDNLPPTRSEGGELIFHLPGDGKILRLTLEEKPKTTEALPITQSSWTLHSQILTRYADGRLLHSARIQAQADSGSGLSLTLALPPNVSRVTVESEDLRDWKLAPRTAEARLVQVDWKTRDTLDRTLLVSWEIPQSPLAESWTLSPPRPLAPEAADLDATDAAESRTLIALVPVDGLELTHPSLQSLVESQRLPEWLRENLGADDSLTAEIVGDTPIRLSATWLPRMETAQATISLAQFDTRLVADGSMLVTADYTVQHSAPLSWKIVLPSADQILTCEVNRKAAKPIQRADNEIEFRLPTPTSLPAEEGEDSITGTTVHLSYALRSDSLDPVSGRVALELPQTELFIHQLDWSLAIPDLYEPTAVEGNVQLSTDSSKSRQGSSMIYLKKELCRGERPSVEIYYQRKDLTTKS